MSTKIEWCEETWNPLIGCSKVSPGCKNCYAIQTAWIRQHNPKMAERYVGVVEKTPGGSLNWTGKVNVVDSVLEKPLKKKTPTMYFVNSMSDLFHEAVPFEIIDKIFAVMALCPQHTFQVLTKRPARMVEYFQRHYAARVMTELDTIGDENPDLFEQCCKAASSIVLAQEPVFPNVWLGVSVENQQTANERIPLLLQVPAAVRFLSCEPLIGPVSFRWAQWHDYGNPEKGIREIRNGQPGLVYKELDGIKGIHWVIVGGESGHGARPMHPEWARSLRDQCVKAGVSYFFKQWGAYTDVNNILPMPMEDFSKNVKAGKWVCVDNTGAIVSHVGGPNNAVLIAKVSKGKAGRQLDGREWNEYPGKKVEPIAEDPDLHFTGPDY